MTDQKVTLTIDFTGIFQSEEIKQWTDNFARAGYPPHVVPDGVPGVDIFKAMMKYDLEQGRMTIDELFEAFEPEIKTVTIKDVE